MSQPYSLTKNEYIMTHIHNIYCACIGKKPTLLKYDFSLLDKSKNYSNMEKTYIGFVEHNGNEGEDFGCYVENTIENLALLNKMEEKHNLLFGDDTWDNEVVFDLDGFTEKDLLLIEYGAGNSYHSRCMVIDQEQFVQKVDLFINEQIEGEEAYPIYKGAFQLKNGEYASFWKDD